LRFLLLSLVLVLTYGSLIVVLVLPTVCGHQAAFLSDRSEAVMSPAMFNCSDFR